MPASPHPGARRRDQLARGGGVGVCVWSPGARQATERFDATRISPRGAMLAFDPPLINPEDITIPMYVPGADEAIALICRHHEVWLSTQKNFQRV